MKSDTVAEVYHGDALDAYADWPTPEVIVSDGAYGVDGFETDMSTPSELPEWYRPHVEAWTGNTRGATLWFWNTERGWAEVHPLLESHGWEYCGVNVWDKGSQYLAGNTNTERLRRFPQTTEVCVQYVRYPRLDGKHPQQWVRDEWERTGLPFHAANDACGVDDAATRRYLNPNDADWYWPPVEKFADLVEYANTHGDSDGAPYFALDGVPVSAENWAALRPKFDCPVGVRNVWEYPKVGHQDRDGHPTEKPAALMERIIVASSEPGDVIWEPFGGTCPAATVAARTGRNAHAAELQQEYVKIARDRVDGVDRVRSGHSRPGLTAFQESTAPR